MRQDLHLTLAVTFVGLLLIAGCSSDSTKSGTGELRMYLTDNPAQYDSVNIVVTGVEVHSANGDSLGGWSVINPDTAIYDLLTLRNGADTILGDQMLPVGHYTQIRLHLGPGSYIVVDGVRHDLHVSANSTVMLNHQFSIQEGSLYELTLDFDASRSIHLMGMGEYRLSPVIRVEANVVSGTISGTVSPASAHSIVSTVAGLDTVNTFCDTTTGGFRLMALPAGTYDVTIAPGDTAYRDTTISDVSVTAMHDTNIGNVVLTPR